MLFGIVSHLEKQQDIIKCVEKTSNIFERMRGLLFRKKLMPDQGLWIEPCPSVHTIGMRYSIDVVFIDEAGLVLKVVNNLSPMRMAMCKNAVASLELLAGMANKFNIHSGQKLMWSKKENN